MNPRNVSSGKESKEPSPFFHLAERNPTRLGDFFISYLLKKIQTPTQIKEILFFFCMELALKSNKLSKRKSWELIACLISETWGLGVFPPNSKIDILKKNINSLHRNRESRTSEILDSLKMFELGEAELKKFFSATAWKGFPGFTEDGTPLK